MFTHAGMYTFDRSRTHKHTHTQPLVMHMASARSLLQGESQLSTPRQSRTQASAAVN